ncbi:hypothetical protein FHX41_3085 [Actinomadura hallensis]|uniref:Uncharacterized protein n=1 Tax=Actinomadura hallensis TaxID=337895 RepID=A0A543IFN1_9ACTN|nr:hypothetical protein [Actinomadura hallensis]TQM69391.1 hypothetical protein FHX41_3085 [Actinomadura hallensis]HLV74365.1 hypothetical protein [Vulgatibacteraceae bacterium]
MAPPPFSMYSPKTPDGDGGPDVAPVFGAGPGDDPGYFASLRGRTELGRLRLMMLVLVAAPVLILAISPMIVQGGGDAPPWTYLPLAGMALTALAVGPLAPRPMEPGGDPREVAKVALLMFRQAVLLRFALAEAVILAGLPLAMVGESELVFVAGFVFGYPLLIWLALPTRGGVERMRRRLEARGAESHLWAVLLAPPQSGTPGQGGGTPA